MIKKHRRKAAFTKTDKSLFSQSSKMIEKIAYRGQQAAHMDISMHMYIQQGLAALIQTLQSDDVNTDRAIQQVRDIFAISTKSLDQFGRTGAFHHIIRRQLAMTDTGLYDLDDSTELSNLPLSGDGIFGSVFNSFKGGLGNRNFEKKGQFDNKGQNSRPNNFRIPKFNKNNSAQGTRGDKTAGRRQGEKNVISEDTDRGSFISFLEGMGTNNSRSVDTINNKKGLQIRISPKTSFSRKKKKR